MLSGTNVRAQTAKFLQTVSGNAIVYNRLCTIAGMEYQTNKYDIKPLNGRGMIQVYALGSIASYLATKFDHKELVSDDVSRNDILAIMVRFFDDKMIKTGAGAVDKSGQFYFMKLFEQGDTVPERDKFLLDKWTPKNKGRT